VSIMQTTKAVLVADDDDVIRNAIGNILRNCDCSVTEVVSVEDAKIELEKQHYDIVFCDMRFKGGIGGEALLEYVNAQITDTDMVMMSCSMDAQKKREMMSMGAATCMQKPFFRADCLDVIAELDASHKKSA